MSDDKDKYTLTIDQIPAHDNAHRDVYNVLYCRTNSNRPKHMTVQDALDELYPHTAEEAARYRWLRDNVFEVNCEGRPADCNAKWMLPRLVSEDSTGRKFTFDEIIDIQMKRGEKSES